MKGLVPISKSGLIITNVRLCTGNTVSIFLFIYDDLSSTNQQTDNIDDALLRFSSCLV